MNTVAKVNHQEDDLHFIEGDEEDPDEWLDSMQFAIENREADPFGEHMENDKEIENGDEVQESNGKCEQNGNANRQSPAKVNNKGSI